MQNGIALIFPSVLLIAKPSSHNESPKDFIFSTEAYVAIRADGISVGKHRPILKRGKNPVGKYRFITTRHTGYSRVF
jgi:hypothetical protein